VLLVGCRGGVCPFEILFEPQSGHGDLAAGRTAGPGVAATLTAGAGAARRTHPAGRRREHDTNLVVAATLTASYAAGTPGGDGTDTLIVHPPHPGLGPGRDAGPVRGPRPDGHADGSSGGQPATDESDAAASLYTIQGGSGYGGLWMTEGGPSYTLDTGHPHLVALPAPPTPAASPTPDTSEQPPAPMAVRARSFSQNQRGEVLTAEVAASLGTGGGKPGQGYPAVVISTDVHAAVPSAGIRDEPQRASAGQPAPEPPPVPPLLPVVSGTLTGRAGKGPNSTVDDGAIILDLDAPQGRCAVGAGGAHAVLPDADPAAADTTLDGEHVDPAHIGVTVRRLTPRECERLQGFPDGWTALDANRRPVADAARYRAMGNAVAVPVVAWIGQRLLTAAHADAAGGAGSEGDASHPASPPRPAARPGLPAPNFGEVPRA